MTEITAKRDIFMLRTRAPRYVIDPVAFFIALIGGPVLITALTFFILLIPVFALVFGGAVYLAIGTPLLLWHLRSSRGTGGDIAKLALLSVLVACGALAGIGVLIQEDQLMSIAAFYACFGAIFAPAWGIGFAFIYDKLRSDFSRRPH